MSFASEIAYAVNADHQIRPENCTSQQLSRGLRLLNILRQTFCSIPKAAIILSAHAERSPNFSVRLRTRPEAIHFRSQAMSKSYKDYKVSTVAELVNPMEYDIHRCARMIGCLGPMVDRTGLHVLPVDLAMILLTSLKAAVPQYVVVRSIAESYADIQLAALRYQSAQRLWPGKERIKGKARRKAKETKEVKVRPRRIRMPKAKVLATSGAKPTNVCWHWNP